MHRPYSSLFGHAEPSSSIHVGQTRVVIEPISRRLTPSRVPPGYRSLSDMEISPHGYQHGSIHGRQNTSYHGEDPISHSPIKVHLIEFVESQVHMVISNDIFTG